MDPEAAAEWIIRRIEGYAKLRGVKIPKDILDIFRTPVRELGAYNRERVIQANNLGVAAIREIVVREKARGARTVRVRPGLTLPLEWHHHYETIYMTDLPWFISGVVQNAFLVNQVAGETRKWRSL